MDQEKASRPPLTQLYYANVHSDPLSPSPESSTHRQVLYGFKPDGFEEVYDTLSIQNDMQERFDEHETARFLKEAKNEPAQERIDDILLYEQSRVKLDIAKNLASRPTTTTTALQPLQFSNRESDAHRRPQSALQQRQSRSGQASIGQRSDVKGSLSDTQELVSFIQNVARKHPSGMGYSENLKTLLGQSRRAHNKLASLRSDLFSVKTCLTPNNLEFGSKCPIPLHPHSSASRVGFHSPNSEEIYSEKTLSQQAFNSTGSLRPPSAVVRPVTASSRLQSSQMIQKMLSEHRKLDEMMGSTCSTTKRVSTAASPGFPSSRTLSSTIVKYRNNDFDNFKTKTTKCLLGKVNILKPRLAHNKGKYLKTLKSIKYFEKATKEHYQMLQNHQSQYRPDQINLIANSQKNVDAVLKANAREDPFSLAHQALKVVQLKYYKNTNKPLGTQYNVDYYQKKRSEIPAIVKEGSKQRSCYSFQPALTTSRMVKSHSSQSLLRPQSAAVLREEVMATQERSQSGVGGSFYDENDPDIQQIKELDRNQEMEVSQGAPFFTDEGEMFNHNIEEEQGERKRSKSRGKRKAGKKLKLHLNITPRVMPQVQTSESDDNRFFIVGKNVNPKNLRQISETELIKIQQQIASNASTQRFSKKGVDLRNQMVSAAVETLTAQEQRSLKGKEGVPRSASSSPQLTADLAGTQSGELAESQSSMRAIKKELRNLHTTNYSNLGPSYGTGEDSNIGTPQMPLSPVNDSQKESSLLGPLRSEKSEELIRQHRTKLSSFGANQSQEIITPAQEHSPLKLATVYQSRNFEIPVGEVTEEKEATQLSEETKEKPTEPKSNRRVLLIKDPHRKSGLPTPHGDTADEFEGQTKRLMTNASSLKMMNSAPSHMRIKKYVSNESNSETTTEAIQGMYEEGTGKSEELYARWQKEFNNVQSRKQDAVAYTGVKERSKLWETGQTSEESKSQNLPSGRKTRSKPSLMQMSQVSLPLDQASMKFTLSEDRRQQELGGVVQFNDYYETGPEQGTAVRDLKKGDPSKLLYYLEMEGGEVVFGNYINTVFPPSVKRRPTSAAYRPSSANASSKPPRPWSGVSRKRSDEVLKRHGSDVIRVLDPKILQTEPRSQRIVTRKKVHLGVYGTRQ